MSEDTIPEELLREILSYHFATPEERFFKFPDPFLPRWRERYQGRRPSYRPTFLVSNVLLVSKRWLRIGTALLYHSVAIWEQKHTKAIAQLLKANPSLGRAIRWLRLQGGLGKDLHAIVKFTPNIDMLLICFRVRASEGVAGFRKALPLFHPTKLYLVSSGYGGDTKATMEIQAMLCVALKNNWTSLVSIFVITMWQHLTCLKTTVLFCRGFDMTSDLAQALSKAPALENITAYSDYANSIEEWIRHGYIQTIAQNPSLREVTCIGKRGQEEIDKVSKAANLPVRIWNMLKYEEAESDKLCDLCVPTYPFVTSLMPHR